MRIGAGRASGRSWARQGDVVSPTGRGMRAGIGGRLRSTSMRIAVIGAGAVGGYYGGMLARAGNDVILIARGAHLGAIRERGLTVRASRGEFTVHPGAADSPGKVGPVDLVLLAVKT